MKNKLKKLYSALILGGVVLVTIGCGAGAPPAEEAVPVIEFETPTPATSDNTLSQSSLPAAAETTGPPATPTDLPTELIETSSPLTLTAAITESLTLEIAETPPAELPTELVGSDAPISSTVSPLQEPIVTTSTSRVVPPAGGEASLEAAITDLATTLAITPESSITLIAMEVMEWSDTSLGCPQEGVMYAQVITLGYLIILEAEGQQYEYHTDQTTTVVNCGEINEPSGSRAIAPLEGGQVPLEAALADLTANLGLSPEAISLISMEATHWSDASLGCPQKGYMYAQVITPGYLIILEAEGQQYEYHTDQTVNVVLCEGQQP